MSMEWIARERQVDDGDRSDEDFDRLAFAAHALERLQIRDLRIALCPLRARRSPAEIALATGRDWNTPEGRWATLFIPADASRRAIVAALAALTVDPISPYLLNALISPSASDPMSTKVAS
jgi:hypothetical protein